MGVLVDVCSVQGPVNDGAVSMAKPAGKGWGIELTVRSLPERETLRSGGRAASTAARPLPPSRVVTRANHVSRTLGFAVSQSRAAKRGATPSFRIDPIISSSIGRLKTRLLNKVPIFGHSVG